jgi:polysaccharide export outer membrane protein
MMRWCAWCGLVLVLGACMPQAPMGYDWDKISASQEFEIGPDDVLSVEFWTRKDLNKEVRVRPDGRIDLPLIGEVKAQGLTPEGLKAVIVERMREFENEPVVTVTVKEARSYRVYVLGKVARPGMFQPSGKVTVLQALALSGGLTPFADADSAVIVRREGEVETRYPFIYSLVLGGEHSQMNIVLASGDTVVIP